MARKLLSVVQTGLFKDIRTEIESALNRKIFLNDILISINNRQMLNMIADRIKILYDNKERQDKLNKIKKTHIVYAGELLVNGLKYNAIVAVKNKTELKKLLNNNIDGWNEIKTEHVNIAITSPGSFFIRMGVCVGRPSINNYTKLER
jgi:hypothetical protein